METLKIIKELVEKMSVDTMKVFLKGNNSAAIRARKHAQEIKDLMKIFRKEVLDEIKRQNNLKEKKETKKGDVTRFQKEILESENKINEDVITAD